MTAQLAPLGRQKFFDNNGNPLALGWVYTYAAGGLIPQASYVDSTQTTQNANPQQLDFRGEMPLWLDPTLGYKINVTDQFGNQIPGWPVDNISGSVFASAGALIPTVTNTFALGSPTRSWAQLYLGPAPAPAFDSVSGNIGYYARTPAEIAAGVTPVNYAYAPGDVRRYGFVGNNIADDTTPVQTAINVWAQGGPAPYFPYGAKFKITAAITIPNNLILNLNTATIVPTGSAAAFTLGSVCGVLNGFLNLQSTTGRGISVLASQQQITLRDLHFTCGAGTGIELVDCFGVYANNLRLDSGSGRAIYIRATIPSTQTNSMVWDRISIGNFTSATDIFTVEGGSGIIIMNLDSENNASGANDVRITSNASDATTNVEIRGAYFETGPSLTGNLIQVDVGTGSLVQGVKISRIYCLTSKQPVNVLTSAVSTDIEITSNVFQAGVGSPTYAISVPAGFVPNCHSNTGSQIDLNRAFTPTLLFGGAAVGQTGTYIGRYNRIGNRMFGEFQITLTALGSSTGAATVGGLPLASYSIASPNGSAGVNFASNMASFTSPPVGRIGASGSAIGLAESNNTTGTIDLSQANFTNTSVLYGWFCYEVAG